MKNVICPLLLASALTCGLGAAPKKSVPRKPPTVDASSTFPHLGVYRWGAPKGPGQVDAFAAWVGRPDVWAEDFEASDQWGNVQEPTSWQFGPWQQWLKEAKGRRLILTVPMLVGPWDGSGPSLGPDAKQPVSLNIGAAGAYNHYYQTLAKNLVAYGLGDSRIRLGHEMSGGWYTWRAGVDPAAYAAYWRQIVTTMRAVPGAQGLKFVWNPALGDQQFPAEQCYPGDEFVDTIGLDVYDDSWAADTYPLPPNADTADIAARRARAWNDVVLNGDHGLVFWQKFADQHKKPFAIPEWGVSARGDGHGGLDDAQFIQNMYDYMKTHPVAFDVYFDVNAGDGAHQLSPGAGADQTPKFPLSAAKFRALFGSAP